MQGIVVASAGNFYQGLRLLSIFATELQFGRTPSSGSAALSFHQTLQFLKAHNAPPDVTAEEHREEFANLDRMISR